MKLTSRVFALSILLGTAVFAPAQTTTPEASIEAYLAEVKSKATPGLRNDALIIPGAKLISFKLEGNVARLEFNDALGKRAWEPESAIQLKDGLRAALGSAIPTDAELQIFIQYIEGPSDKLSSTMYPFENYIVGRESVRARGKGTPKEPLKTFPVVQTPDYPGPARDAGLAGRNIAVAPSHGWTWHKDNRWQLQRARVYTIVEDLYPQSFTNPFLLPMLEKAGANVWSLRERDYQTAEVIVDNDGAAAKSEFAVEGAWESIPGAGWKGPRPASLATDAMPFTMGTTLRVAVDANTPPATAKYTPYIPRDGRFAVYAAWSQAQTNSPSVPIKITHLGGVSTVRVNQQVAGGTWVFLGFYEFAQGTTGNVIVSTEGAAQSGGESTTVSIDALRFGGGMGNIAPENQHISNKPRYAEAARYFVQYLGAPTSIFFGNSSVGHFGRDYNRDITARSEFVNYLVGAPSGPNSDRTAAGLGVPLDLYLAFHTDAGSDPDGLVGLLNIYRIKDDLQSETFPDGRSRWLNRDLTTMMHQEIIRTARANFTTGYPRRTMYDVGFGEVRRPNVPSTILELLSHHNFNDMKFGLDPRFKRDIARAIYKSIARFIAYQEDREPVIQPLDPTGLAVRGLGGGKAELTWAPMLDPLEPTAKPDGYIVYRSANGRGFDSGSYTTETTFVASEVTENTTAFFKVSAANTGGESFTTPIVAVRQVAGKKTILLVDGFNRLSGPAIVENGNQRGFDRAGDPGVSYEYNYGVVGDMYDFDPKSEWVDDLVSPGWGGSTGHLEDLLELGNHFNHVVAYAQVLGAAVTAVEGRVRQAE